ncbi:protein rep, partial [Streptococcus ruminantium]|uniref:protein rep n=1 Tax=Streptococcus ruminantium TaxID=1917441 RepID=UPI001D1486FB
KIKRSEEKLTQITGELLEGLYKKRQLGFGGLLKEIRKEMKLDDIENGDLVNTSDEDKPKASKAEIIVAYWNYTKGNYFIKQ